MFVKLMPSYSGSQNMCVIVWSWVYLLCLYQRKQPIQKFHGQCLYIFVEDNATMRSIRFFENPVTYFVLKEVDSINSISP